MSLTEGVQTKHIRSDEQQLNVSYVCHRLSYNCSRSVQYLAIKC